MLKSFGEHTELQLNKTVLQKYQDDTREAHK